MAAGIVPSSGTAHLGTQFAKRDASANVRFWKANRQAVDGTDRNPARASRSLSSRRLGRSRPRFRPNTRFRPNECEAPCRRRIRESAHHNSGASVPSPQPVQTDEGLKPRNLNLTPLTALPGNEFSPADSSRSSENAPALTNAVPPSRASQTKLTSTAQLQPQMIEARQPAVESEANRYGRSSHSSHQCRQNRGVQFC